MAMKQTTPGQSGKPLSCLQSGQLVRLEGYPNGLVFLVTQVQGLNYLVDINDGALMNRDNRNYIPVPTGTTFTYTGS